MAETLESRRRIVISDTSALRILSVNVEQPWLNTRKTICVSFEATQAVYARVEYQQLNQPLQVISDIQRLGRRHSLYLSNVLPGHEIRIVVRCISKTNDTITQIYRAVYNQL